MTPTADTQQLHSFLRRLVQRDRLASATLGLSIGAALATSAALILLRSGSSRSTALLVGVALVVAVTVGLLMLRQLSSPDSQLLLRIDAQIPESRNLLVTAAELLHGTHMKHNQQPHPSGSAHVATRIFAESRRIVERADITVLVPLQKKLLVASLFLAVWLATVTLLTAASAASPLSDVELEDLRVGAITVEVIPPAYSGMDADTLRDPARINALQGSELRISVQAVAAAVSMETLSGTQQLAESGGIFSTNIAADADGFIALQPAASDGRRGDRLLLGLDVTEDLPPTVRITTPSGDLLTQDSTMRVSLVVEAADDIALADLRLIYTRVSGSGEQFTFDGGEVALKVDRPTQRGWSASASWELAPVGLGRGDMVVYRAVARDNRPGSPEVESDSFIIERVGVGAIASDGFAIDDTMDRYALSQQMIILKTEQLLTARSGRSAEQFARDALEIAAEQRSVRAEFVFMMGGELSEFATEGADMHMLHEEDHAAADDEVIAGRLANQGRVELLRSIRAMSVAASLLTGANVDSALTQEKVALEYLQRAFARTRYILRTLTLRERLDMTRRLGGSLAGALGDATALVPAEVPARVSELRNLLADIATLASGAATGPAGPGADRTTPGSITSASELAERAIRLDPQSGTLREVATLLGGAVGGVTTLGRGSAVAREAVDSAATLVVALLRAETQRGTLPTRSTSASQLAGALADALRGRTRR